tara:strand:- start:665 stop:829 length:165 start_codon:yes stop_codon:yes gene_type:complete
MTKIKTRTINKWDNTTPLQETVGKVLKTLALITFLSVWIPAFFYVVAEFVKFFF